MIPVRNLEEAITHGHTESVEATVEMNPEMFELLSASIYKDKVLAVIREIICNARDANVEAGSDKPLDVHLPNSLEPFFSVRDYGEGLEHSKLLDLYLTYGKSTKQGSNKSIGGFGIGCKSPLAYNSSFIVESVHNGIKTTYNILKDKGIPNIRTLSKTPSDDPTGLCVKVAVKTSDYDEFIRKSEQFIKHFNFPINVTGSKINTNVNVLCKGSDFEVIKDRSCYNLNLYVRMGGVMYPVSPSAVGVKNGSYSVATLLSALKLGYCDIILDYPIGSFPISASRESLSEDKVSIQRIIDRISTLRNEVLTEFLKRAKDEHLSLHEVYLVMKGLRVTEKEFNDFGSEFTSSDRHVLSAVSELTYETEWNRGIARLQNKIGGNIALLVKDTKTNFNPVKAMLKLKYSEVIFLQEEGHKEKLVLLVKYLKGSKHKLNVYYCSTQYPKIRKARKKSNKVSCSGIFDSHMNEVTELNKSSRGYYIPIKAWAIDDMSFKRLGGAVATTPTLKSCFNKLLKLKVIDPQTKLYFVRKSGMKAIEGTKIKKLTPNMFKKFVKRALSKEDIEGMNRKSVANIFNMNFLRYLPSKLKTILVEELDVQFVDFFSTTDRVGDIEYLDKTLNLGIYQSIDDDNYKKYYHRKMFLSNDIPLIAAMNISLWPKRYHDKETLKKYEVLLEDSEKYLYSKIDEFKKEGGKGL